MLTLFIFFLIYCFAIDRSLKTIKITFTIDKKLCLYFDEIEYLLKIIY
jgi:hypothetical protein